MQGAPTKRLFRVAMLDPSQGFIDPWGKFGDLEYHVSERFVLSSIEDGMPFHTQACKEYTDGCFDSFKPRFDTSLALCLWVNQAVERPVLVKSWASSIDGWPEENGSQKIFLAVSLHHDVPGGETHRSNLAGILFCKEILKGGMVRMHYAFVHDEAVKLFLMTFPKTAPMAKSLASHISSNGRSQFGAIKIGASREGGLCGLASFTYDRSLHTAHPVIKRVGITLIFPRSLPHAFLLLGTTMYRAIPRTVRRKGFFLNHPVQPLLRERIFPQHSNLFSNMGRGNLFVHSKNAYSDGWRQFLEFQLSRFINGRIAVLFHRLYAQLASERISSLTWRGNQGKSRLLRESKKSLSPNGVRVGEEVSNNLDHNRAHQSKPTGFKKHLPRIKGELGVWLKSTTTKFGWKVKCTPSLTAGVFCNSIGLEIDDPQFECHVSWSLDQEVKLFPRLKMALGLMLATRSANAKHSSIPGNSKESGTCRGLPVF
ncbi:hypothetical protein Tco_0365327 [Tanacetum coccineum]